MKKFPPVNETIRKRINMGILGDKTENIIVENANAASNTNATNKADIEWREIFIIVIVSLVVYVTIKFVTKLVKKNVEKKITRAITLRE
jgi:uncharacterized Rmd1/YagE family protein